MRASTPDAVGLASLCSRHVHLACSTSANASSYPDLPHSHSESTEPSILEGLLWTRYKPSKGGMRVVAVLDSSSKSIEVASHA